MLQLHRDEHFGRLTLPGAGKCEEHVARKLHGERGGALFHAATLQIDVGGAQDADGIETGVGEKPLVFGRQNRVAQRGRNILVADDALFFPVAVVKVGDQFRFQFIQGPAAVVAEGNNL